MSKIIVCRGLPGSGKSTWAREFCQKNTDYVRVCRDDLRSMRGAYWLPKDEDMITQMEDACIEAAINNGKNVVLDATNLSMGHIAARMIQFAHIRPDFSSEVKDFTDVPFWTCIERDAKRPEPVGYKVIRDMYDKWLRPAPIKQDPDLPRAIIVDIDGTLADHEGIRGPFEWKRVGEDRCKQFVAELVRRYYNTHTVFIFSGRDEICRLETKDWLSKYVIPYHELHMRPQGNSEKDSIIKRRLFDHAIAGKYYVDMVIDDRLAVCRQWNEMGLNLLRVGDPDANF